MNEMEMWSQKFDSYALEKNSVHDIINSNKHNTTGCGVRSNSVGNRLYKQKNSNHNSETNTIDSQNGDEEFKQRDELEDIKFELERLDIQL